MALKTRTKTEEKTHLPGMRQGRMLMAMCPNGATRVGLERGAWYYGSDPDKFARGSMFDGENLRTMRSLHKNGWVAYTKVTEHFGFKDHQGNAIKTYAWRAKVTESGVAAVQKWTARKKS